MYKRQLESGAENANARAAKAEKALIDSFACVDALVKALLRLSRFEVHMLSQPAYRRDLRPALSDRVRNMLQLSQLLPHQVDEYDPMSTERASHAAPVQVPLYAPPEHAAEPEPAPAAEGEGEGAAAEGDAAEGGGEGAPAAWAPMQGEGCRGRFVPRHEEARSPRNLAAISPQSGRDLPAVSL